MPQEPEESPTVSIRLCTRQGLSPGRILVGPPAQVPMTVLDYMTLYPVDTWEERDEDAPES